MISGFIARSKRKVGQPGGLVKDARGPQSLMDIPRQIGFTAARLDHIML